MDQAQASMVKSEYMDNRVLRQKNFLDYLNRAIQAGLRTSVHAFDIESDIESQRHTVTVTLFEVFRIRPDENECEKVTTCLTSFTAQNVVDMLTHCTVNDGWEYRVKEMPYPADIIDLNNYVECVEKADKLRSLSQDLWALDNEKSKLITELNKMSGLKAELELDVERLRLEVAHLANKKYGSKTVRKPAKSAGGNSRNKRK